MYVRGMAERVDTYVCTCMPTIAQLPLIGVSRSHASRHEAF